MTAVMTYVITVLTDINQMAQICRILVYKPTENAPRYVLYM